MARPTNPFGGAAPWVKNPDGSDVPGETAYDSDLEDLPLTAALRNAWGVRAAHPVASAAAMAAVFNAVADLETRVIALET